MWGILSRTTWDSDKEREYLDTHVDVHYTTPYNPPDKLTWETVDAFQQEIAERLIRFNCDDLLLMLGRDYDFAFQKLSIIPPIASAAVPHVHRRQAVKNA